MDSQPSQRTPALLALPHEIRAKIYAYLLPASISLTVGIGTSDSAKTNSDTAVSLSPTPVALASILLSYTSTTYRYAGKASFVTNATRPAFRELAMACRATRAELMPLIVARLHPRCESVAAACGLATRQGGSLAQEMLEVTIMRPFSGMIRGEKTSEWAVGDGELGREKADAVAEEVAAWMGLMAQLLPGLRTLRVYDMPYGGENDHLLPEWRVLDDAMHEGVRAGWPDLLHATKSLVPGTRSAVVVWRADVPVWEKTGTSDAMLSWKLRDEKDVESD